MTIKQALNEAVGSYKAGNIEAAKRLLSRIIQIEMMAEVVNGLVVRLLLLPLNKIMEVEAIVEVVAVMVVVGVVITEQDLPRNRFSNCSSPSSHSQHVPSFIKYPGRHPCNLPT